MKIEDFIGPICGCPECRQAGVADQEQRRDRQTGVILHGFALKRWLEARDKFMAEARAAVGPKGRHAKGFEKLAEKP